ncbi:hypothetical protein B0H11DRAFT_1915008 [Mycena galericulata]|nr:hypothetical protein B0H11DRAFT_1915008 [Mycena galericulata]
MAEDLQMSFPYLPPELWALVFKSQPLSALVGCCLLSKSFYTVARRQLYSDVVIGVTILDIFRDCLTVDNAKFVFAFTVVDPNNVYRDCFDEKCADYQDTVAKLASRFWNLKHLTLCVPFGDSRGTSDKHHFDPVLDLTFTELRTFGFAANPVDNYHPPAPPYKVALGPLAAFLGRHPRLTRLGLYLPDERDLFADDLNGSPPILPRLDFLTTFEGPLSIFNGLQSDGQFLHVTRVSLHDATQRGFKMYNEKHWLSALSPIIFNLTVLDLRLSQDVPMEALNHLVNNCGPLGSLLALRITGYSAVLKDEVSSRVPNHSLRRLCVRTLATSRRKDAISLASTGQALKLAKAIPYLIALQLNEAMWCIWRDSSVHLRRWAFRCDTVGDEDLAGAATEVEYIQGNGVM